MPFSATPTYAELKAEVQSWLDRDDDETVGRIPSFIRYAGDEIARTLRIPLVRQTSTGTVSSERVTLPGDCRAVRSLNIADSQGWELRSTSEGLRASHAAAWAAGRPREFVVEFASIAFAPVPDRSYTFILSYDAAPLVLSDDADTNTVLTQTPFAYLQGALAAGFAFNQFTTQAELYDAKFRATLAGMQAQGLKDAMPAVLALQPAQGFTP